MYPKGLEVYNDRIIPHILFPLDDLSCLNVVFFSLRMLARHALVVVMEFKLATSAS
jgi:hypothetical protein